jgi:hypothetical protein
LTAFSSGLVAGGLVSGTVVGALGGLVSVVPATGRVWTVSPVLAVITVFELAGRPLRLRIHLARGEGEPRLYAIDLNA